jgi:hypothetical protein
MVRHAPDVAATDPRTDRVVPSILSLPEGQATPADTVAVLLCFRLARRGANFPTVTRAQPTEVRRPAGELPINPPAPDSVPALFPRKPTRYGPAERGGGGATWSSTPTGGSSGCALLRPRRRKSMIAPRTAPRAAAIPA